MRKKKGEGLHVCVLGAARRKYVSVCTVKEREREVYVFVCELCSTVSEREKNGLCLVSCMLCEFESYMLLSLYLCILDSCPENLYKAYISQILQK